MKIYRVLFAAIVFVGLASALQAADNGKIMLAGVRHNYEHSGESVAFLFQNADGTPASAVPMPEVAYNETALNLRLSFSGVVSQVADKTAKGLAVSAIESQNIRDRTVVYIFLKKPVNYYVKRSPGAGMVIVGMYNVESGGYWVRVRAPNWRSADAAYPFWNALKKAAILTCLLQDESGDYFLSSLADMDTLERAEQTCKTVQAVIDSALDEDILQVSRPLASVGTIADSAGESWAAPPPEDIAAQIDAAVAKLASDPAVIDAGVREQIISPTMREIIGKYGEQAIPSLAVAATSQDNAPRRSALLTLAAIGGIDVAQFLIDGLADTEPIVRQEMLLALERLPRTRAMLATLKSEIDDGDKWARFFAARMLTRAWMPDAVPILLRALADDELRDEAAAILQQYVNPNISSEALAGLSPEETQAVINDLLAKWDADKGFVTPLPSLDITVDLLGKVFSGVYPADKVTCRIADDNANVMMERSGADGTKRVSILQFLSGNLDNDADLETVVVVGEDNVPPRAVAAIDGEDGSGDLMWIERTDPAAASDGARAYLTDIDGDGVCEIILAEASAKDGVRAANLAIYRAGKTGLTKVFSAACFTDSPPTAQIPTVTRAFLGFRAGAQGPRDIALESVSRAVVGDNQAESNHAYIYPWKGEAYDTTPLTGVPDAGPATGGPTDMENPPTPPNQEDPAVVQPKPENPPRFEPGKGTVLLAVKSDKKLYVYVDGKLTKTYDAKFGSAPGDKEIEGDLKTPEGEFHVCVKNPTSRYHLSLGLSYPNKEDAERGLKAGIITREQYDRIVAAIDRQAPPPWKTPLGGEIFIHGEAESREDTHGCIALFNKDMDELYPMVAEGTKAIIKP